MADVAGNDFAPEDRINILEMQNLSYWSEELNLKIEELKDIISLVGPRVHDVRVYLAKKLLKNWTSEY